MNTLFIYMDAPKDFAKCMRVVKPSEKFTGNWVGLVESITGSDFRNGIKKYNSYEVI